MEWIVLAVFALGAYLLPSIIAVTRSAPSPGSTIAINVLLGWTLVGWAAAMAMALRSKQPPTVVHVQQLAPALAPHTTPPGHVPPPPATYPQPDGRFDVINEPDGESSSGKSIGRTRDTKPDK